MLKVGSLCLSWPALECYLVNQAKQALIVNLTSSSLTHLSLYVSKL